jgi:hypothetical protein
MNKKLSGKKMIIVSFALLIAMVIALVTVSYSWYVNQRSLSTATWIKTPIILTIGSGKNHDIKYLDMGDIDVESTSSKDYVICVYGTPVDNYSLQLAYTTNIAFHYEVYRAEETSDTEHAVASTYVDADGNAQTEYFQKSNDTPVITGLTLSEIAANNDTVAAHQSHYMSYGDEYGLNPIDKTKVQSNAEPLYWLAEEDGTNVLQPKNTIKESDGTEASLDYFIISVSWNPDEVKNDKETDIVYLTVSR